MAAGGTVMTMVVLRLLVSLVLFYAGVLKVADPSGFFASIEAYQLFGYKTTWLIVAFMPWLEIAVALALWVKALRRGACLWANVLVASFTLLLVITWARGVEVDCGCFGSLFSGWPMWALALRDLVGMIACVWLWKHETWKETQA